MSEEAFRTGVYRHYKGGKYTALALVTHHETRQPMVLYVSHTTGTLTVRPLRPMHEEIVGGQSRFVDLDAWDDWVEYEGQRVRRFAYEGSGEKVAHVERLLGLRGHCSRCDAKPNEPCREPRG
jgi:hypothetical protein